MLSNLYMHDYEVVFVDDKVISEVLHTSFPEMMNGIVLGKLHSRPNVSHIFIGRLVAEKEKNILRSHAV